MYEVLGWMAADSEPNHSAYGGDVTTMTTALAIYPPPFSPASPRVHSHPPRTQLRYEGKRKAPALQRRSDA
jgi:hypothetical protein